MLKKLIEILKSYTEDKLLLFLLVLMCLDSFGSLPFYLCLVFPFLIKKIELSLDNYALLILVFSLIYSLMALLNGYFDRSYGSFIFFCLYPLFFYWVGKYFGTKTDFSLTNLLILIGISFAIMPILAVLREISQDQLINVTRLMTDENGISMGAATIIGTKVSLVLSFMGVVFATNNDRYDILIKLLLIVFSCLGIMTTLHLVNRTGLLVVAASLALSVIINRSSLKHYQLYILLLVIALFIYINRDFLEFMFSESTMAYQERAELGDTGGGRFKIWRQVVDIVTQNPAGVEHGFGIRKGFDYAHNIFLDIPLEAGILPLFLFVAIFIIHIKNLYNLYKAWTPNILLTLIFVMNVAFLIQLISEPVMDGLMVYYFTFFLMIGICSTLSKRKMLMLH